MAERRDAMAGALRYGLHTMVRRGLRGVWLRGELPSGPFVWAANHHSWWDPFVASALLNRLGRAMCLIMLRENLQRYRLLRRLDVFGTNEPRRGLAFLGEGRVLVIYPEGELRNAGPPGDLADGAAWYARRAGVPLCAVATRMVLRGHEAPEAYVSVIQVDASGPVREATSRLAKALEDQLGDMCISMATGDPRRPLPGYRPVVRGRRSWEERIDTVARRWPWRH
jgi:1-acyl-sn-glycerol-3-phosphate acyltransferase